MSKLVLITLGLVVLSMGTSVQTSDSVFEGNYDHLEQFLSSFMNSYTGTNYTMATCLTPQIQAKLDQYLAASLGYLVILKFDEVLKAYESFLYNLAVSCEMCGLNQVQKSLEAGLTIKGKFWFELNLADNLKTVMTMLDTFGTEIKAKNNTASGATLGKITSMLVPYIAPTPPTPTPTLSLELEAFDQTVYLLWWKGLVTSLSINPKKIGPCGTFLTGVANNTVNPMRDLSTILSKNMGGFKTLFGDMAKSLTYMQTYTNTCAFDSLKDNIIELTQPKAMSELLARYATRALSINSAIVNIKNCYTNIYSCGQAYGTIIKYMLNWSIN